MTPTPISPSRRARVGVGAAVAAACLAAPGPIQAQSSGGFVPVTGAMLRDPDPADWLMWRRTLDGWGYSPLDRIGRGNVGGLRMVWSRPLGPGNQQGTPLVHGGVLYMPNPRDVVQAIDAATGDLRWEHRRPRPDDLEEHAYFIEANRNVAISVRSIIGTSADGYVYALDAVTGRPVWETRIVDYAQHPVEHTSGPIVAAGNVVSGRGCLAPGGPHACIVTAHDAATGVEVWRRLLIPAPGEPGDETWGDVPFEQRMHVGAWMPPSFDPDLNLIYVGTSGTWPQPKFLLGGVDKAHLHHGSTLALDADTGEIVWRYQHLNDHWNLDHVFERLLVDTAVTPDPDAVRWINPRLRPGERRRVVTGIPGKTGVVYTLDRATGEFLWATPTVAQNVINHIAGATGAVSENSEVVFTREGEEMLVCPWYATGGRNWEAGAYSPLTHAMYFPLRNACAQMRVRSWGLPSRVARRFGFELSFAPLCKRANPVFRFFGWWCLEEIGLRSRGKIAPGADRVGAVWAISVETGETVWKHEQRAAATALLATGGGLVFVGDVDGRFRALDHETGEVLWAVNLGSSVTGFPITYAVGGRQYVAASTGWSISSNDALRLTPELRPGRGNNLFVFTLPDGE